MGRFKRFAIVVPLVSMVSALALSAQAEDKGPEGAPRAGPAKPGGPAVRNGPGRPGAGPQNARLAPRGPMPSRNFGGHPYHGHLAWEGGAWRRAVLNGRDGWWWDVGGASYYYPEMLDGPPPYVSDVEFVDEGVPDGPPVVGGYPPPPPPGVAAYPPPPPPPPANAASGAVGGALVGGLLGGLLTGRPGGAIAGAVAGGTVGAISGAQAAARPGYYLAQGGCYYRYPSGQYVQVDPRTCY